MAKPGAEDIELLAGAAREASALALTFFRNDPKAWTKAGNSLVTEADIAVNDLLAERLRGARPDYGWLSEETADSPDRLSRKRIFVIDPIDGTRAFLAGMSEWAVALAIVEDGRPIAAALAAPALSRFFTAVAGAGGEVDGVRLAASSRGLDGARFAGPRRYARAALAAAGVDPKSVRFVPSLAYRIALVATGEIEVAISGPDANDWDLAAADLFVQEAGGLVVDLDGRQPRYNKKVLSHPVLIAAPARLVREVSRLIAEPDPGEAIGTRREETGG